MASPIVITKHGTTTPTTANLADFQLGYDSAENILHIRDGAAIITIGGAAMVPYTGAAGAVDLGAFGLTAGGGLTAGVDAATNTPGVLKLWGAGPNNFYTQFTTGTQTGNAPYTLPVAMATANSRALLCSTTGILSWGTDFGANAVTTTGTGTFSTAQVTTSTILSQDVGAGQASMLLSYIPAGGNANVYLGPGAGNLTGTGIGGNVSMGKLTLGAITTGSYNMCFGENAGRRLTTGASNVLIGRAAGDALTTTDSNMGIGRNALVACTGTENVAVGAFAGASLTTANRNVLIGAYSDAPATATGCIVLGDAVVATASNQMVCGTYNFGLSYIDHVYIGCGVTETTGHLIAPTIHATGASGADLAAPAIKIAGGKATGNAVGGNVEIQTSDAGSNGSTLQTLTTKWSVNQAGTLQSGTDGTAARNILTTGTLGAGAITSSATVAGTKFLGPEIKTDTTTPTDLTITTGAAKTLVLATPVYKDINIAGYLLAKPTSSAPGVDTFRSTGGTDTTIETLAFAEDEKVHGGFELQHDYKEGTDLVFHVHWQGIAAPSGTDNVQWRLNYIVSRDGVTLAAATVFDSPDTPIDTQYRCYQTNFAAITGTNFKIGDQFMFTLTRVAAAGDAYAGDALIETAGIHYQVDTMGSRTISAKY